jgi:hypothetical protein
VTRSVRKEDRKTETNRGRVKESICVIKEEDRKRDWETNGSEKESMCVRKEEDRKRRRKEHACKTKKKERECVWRGGETVIIKFVCLRERDCNIANLSPSGVKRKAQYG